MGLIDEGGYLHEYFLPAVLKLRTGQTSSRDGKLVANIGDFDDNGMFYCCTIDKRKHLGLVASSVTCCAADTLSAAAQAHTGDTRFFVGPYAAADADVEAVHSRKMFKIPFFLTSKCGLAAPGGRVTVQYFWTTLYPVIVGLGADTITACKFLIDAFRLAATKVDAADTTSVMDVAEDDLPQCFAPTPAEKHHRKELLKSNLPFRHAGDASQAADVSMSRALDRQTAQMKEQHEYAKAQVKETKTAKRLKSVGGQHQWTYLLKHSGARNWDELPETLRLLIDATSSEERDTILNNAARAVAKTLKLEDPPVFAPGMAARIVTKPWSMEDDEPETGSVYNLLTMGAPAEMAKKLVADAHANAPGRTGLLISSTERKVLDDVKRSWLPHKARLIRSATLWC